MLKKSKVMYYLTLILIITIYMNDFVFHFGFIPVKLFHILLVINIYILFLLIAISRKNIKIKNLSKLDYAVIAYFIVSVLSVIWCNDIYSFFRFLYINIWYLIFYLFLRVNFSSSENFYTLIKIILTLGVVNIIATFVFVAYYGELRAGEMMSSWSNHLSSYAEIAIPFFLAVSLYAAGMKKYFYVLCMLLSIWVIGESYSRAGFISLCVILLMSIKLLINKYGKFYRINNVFFILTVALLALCFINFNQDYLSRIDTIPVTAEDLNLHWNESIRMYMYNLSINVIKEHPILGIGLGSFVGYMDLFAGESVIVHNFILEAWVELGLLGLFAIMLQIYYIYSYLFKMPSKINLSIYKYAAIISVTAIIIHSMFRPLITNPAWYILIVFVISFREKISKNGDVL